VSVAERSVVGRAVASRPSPERSTDAVGGTLAAERRGLRRFIARQLGHLGVNGSGHSERRSLVARPRSVEAAGRSDGPEGAETGDRCEDEGPVAQWVAGRGDDSAAVALETADGLDGAETAGSVPSEESVSAGAAGREA